VTLRGGVWPAWLARAGISLERIGLLRGEKSQKFWADFFYRVLPKLPSGNRNVSGFRVDVHGERNGQVAHVWYAGVDRMKRITSIPAALGALMIAQGKIPQVGAFSPEAVIDPTPFFASLEAHGIRTEFHER
jgi:saccharopine dehydrogenase-like NADP-dependent oxidoreductase